MDNSKQKSCNPPLLGFISAVAIAYFIYYLWWRAAFTLNPEHPAASWLLWAAEAFGVFCYILFAWTTRDVSPTAPHKSPRKGLKVDIFIPTYNEDIEILEATLIGCNRVRYPHATYILDDGNRPQVRELAGRLGCEYIARPVRDHAKAGNINHALRRTDGEFIAILDADMTPQSEYLDRTLGYFEDEKLALIQLPQEFYNSDSIQHDSKTSHWHEQSLFFRVIQPGKNYTNSAFWCGSPSVVRRKALEDVGGVATETITEDIHTTVRMHNRGWKTLFVNEPLAFGIAPQTVKAFLLQRLRWAQGTMQLYRSQDSPLWIPGLTWRQRFSYLSSFLAYFESFQKLILLSMPVFILGFGVLPMSVGVLPFLLRWLPYFAFNILANQLGGRGIFRYFQTEKYNILKIIIFIQSTLTLVSKKPLKFKVTPKTVDETVYAQERKSMRGYMAIFGALAGSMLYALFKVIIPHAAPLGWDAFIIAFFWAGYNAFVIFTALYEVFRKRHDRRQYRFHVGDEGALYHADSPHSLVRAWVIDLSVAGAGLLADAKTMPESGKLMLRVSPAGLNDILIPVEKIHYQRPDASGRVLLGASFREDLGSHRNRLFEYLYVHLPGRDSHSLLRASDCNLLRQVWNWSQRIFAQLRPSRPA